MKLQFKDNEERNSFIEKIAQEDICPCHMGLDQRGPDDCSGLPCDRCWELALEKSSNIPKTVELSELQRCLELVLEKFRYIPKIVKLSELHLWDKFFDPDGESWVVTQIFDDSVEVTKSNLLKKNMDFGKSNNYAESNCREFLNKEYIKEVERKFGSKNILKHEVDLTSMDGFTDYGTVKDAVSIRTFDQYRQQASRLELEDCVEWLATPNQTPKRNDTSYVRVVNSNGRVGYRVCCWDGDGVRPVLHLKSSINVLIK